MKLFRRLLVFVSAFFIVFVPAGDATAGQQCGYDPGVSLKFHSGEKYIYDQYGRVVMFRGVNMASCYHPDEPVFTEKNLLGLQQYGFNFIRLNLGWYKLEPENGKFDIGEMEKIKGFIRKGNELGIYTMPDFHQVLWEMIPGWMRGETPGHDLFPGVGSMAAAQSDWFWESEAHQDELIEFLVFLAEHLKDADGVFGYDLFNEPYSRKGFTYGEFEKCCLFPFYEKAISAIRNVDPDTPIILEPHPMTVVLPAYTRPFPYKNIVYSPHAYFPHTYESEGLVIRKEETPADVRLKYQRFQKEAEKMKAPWLVGEYGGDPVTYPFAGPWLKESMKMQERYFVGSAVWDFSPNGGGGWSINDTADHLKPHMAEILVRPYPRFTTGTPVKLSYDEEKKIFRYRFISDAAICAPTEIFIPEYFEENMEVEIKSECAFKRRHNPESNIILIEPGCDGEVSIVISLNGSEK